MPDDAPLDEFERKLARALGMVETVECGICERTFPAHRLNVFLIRGDYAFICDGCVREPVLGRVARRAAELNPELVEIAETELAQAVLFDQDADVRRQAWEALERAQRRRREQADDDDGTR